MLIDWFTVGAQVLNFVILVWLLKRFLYQPVLDAIDAREARIARQIADAGATQVSALLEQKDFKQRNATFDAQRQALLAQASADAQAERSRLMDAAHQAADAATARRQDAERHAAASLRRGLADRTRAQVLAIVRRVIGDLADTLLDERVAAVFMRRLSAAETATLTSLASGLDPKLPRASVRTAFEPSAALRESLRGAIVAALAPLRTGAVDAPIDVVFETAPDLLGGIELFVGSRKLEWNVTQYLDMLGQVLDQATSTAAPGARRVPADVPAPTPAVVP